MTNDKLTEQERYDQRASATLLQGQQSVAVIGSLTMPLYLRSPYYFYEKKINQLVMPDFSVLEIGAGSGLHTLTLVNTGANVIASDISRSSLELLSQNINRLGLDVGTKTADMESLPFKDNVFHVVTSAGSLSYGDNEVVMNEIYRVLKKNGVFICVDSLNHNPIYRFNRWLHYLRGNRTLSTLNRMPTVDLLKAYGEKFGSIDIRFFGSLSWLAPMLNKIFNDINTSDILDKFDNKFSVKKSAFKFVMVVKKVK